MRRVAGKFLLSLGAILAVLATHALAQPATRPAQGLRPAFEDPNDDTPQRAQTRRPPRRAEPRAGTLPNFDNPETTRTSALRQSGRLRREPHRVRLDQSPPQHRAQSPQCAPSGDAGAGRYRTRAAALADRARDEPDGDIAALDRVRHIGARRDIRHDRRDAEACRGRAPVTPAAAPPRSPLVRIPDGTAAGGVAGTVSTARLTTGSTTLLRRRTAAGGRPVRAARPAHRRVPRSARRRSDRRLRHQSGARARRQGLVAGHGRRPN